MSDRFEKLLPSTGILAGLLFAATMFSTYSTEYGDPDAAKIINDHATRNTIAYLAMSLCCVALLFFAGAIRAALRSGERGASTYSSVAFGAVVLIAATKAFDAILLKAGLDTAERNDLQALDTLAYIGTASWLPWVAASAAFYLAVGLAGLHPTALPRWLAVVTLVMGVACLLGSAGVGPAGIAVYLATPVWLIITGIVLAKSQRSQRAALDPRKRDKTGS